MNGEVPPEKDAMVESAADWPESIAEGVAETAGADAARFTVTVTALDVLVRGNAALSVTCSSKDQDPETDRAPVEADTGDEQAAELPSGL